MHRDRPLKSMSNLQLQFEDLQLRGELAFPGFLGSEHLVQADLADDCLGVLRQEAAQPLLPATSSTKDQSPS